MGFSGAVIVEHRGEVALRRGYGLADRAALRPYTPETVQTHGSITKQVTAAAILLLETRGALEVEDRLDEHCEGVPPDKTGITLHHLLTHTSGLPGSVGPDREPIDGVEFVARAFATPLLFEPGTGFEYSNVGYGEVQAWSVLWRDDGTYRGTAIGPTSDFPAYTLVPTGPDVYVAVEREPPWRSLAVHFAGSCVELGGSRACR